MGVFLFVLAVEAATVVKRKISLADFGNGMQAVASSLRDGLWLGGNLMIMLLLMTYNWGVFIVIVLAKVVGYYIFTLNSEQRDIKTQSTLYYDRLMRSSK